MEAQHIRPRLRPMLDIGPGSGQPNMPKDEPPFVPLNPWGRGFPAPPRPERQPLCQVVVNDLRDGNKEKRIGPAMGREYAEMLCLTIGDQIKLGRERAWERPRVIALIPDKGKPVPFLGV